MRLPQIGEIWYTEAKHFIAFRVKIEEIPTIYNHHCYTVQVVDTVLDRYKRLIGETYRYQESDFLLDFKLDLETVAAKAFDEELEELLSEALPEVLRESE